MYLIVAIILIIGVIICQVFPEAGSVLVLYSIILFILIDDENKDTDRDTDIT
jgi:hypothetical protein